MVKGDGIGVNKVNSILVSGHTIDTIRSSSRLGIFIATITPYHKDKQGSCVLNFFGLYKHSDLLLANVVVLRGWSA